MTLQPRQYLLRAAGRDQHIKPSLGNPPAREGPKQFGLSAIMWPPASRRFPRGLGLGASATHREAQAAQDAASLMSGEVSSIKSRNDADDLFRRIPAPAHNDIMIRDRVRQDVRHRSVDRLGLEIEPVPCDGRMYLSHILWIVFSDMSLFKR